VKIFLDTNVILDYLTEREPFADDAEAVIELCTHDGNEGVLTTLSACNVVYVLSKIVGRRTAEIRLAQLLELLAMTGVAPIRCWRLSRKNIQTLRMPCSSRRP